MFGGACCESLLNGLRISSGVFFVYKYDSHSISNKRYRKQVPHFPSSAEQISAYQLGKSLPQNNNNVGVSNAVLTSALFHTVAGCKVLTILLLIDCGRRDVHKGLHLRELAIATVDVTITSLKFLLNCTGNTSLCYTA